MDSESASTVSMERNNILILDLQSTMIKVLLFDYLLNALLHSVSASDYELSSWTMHWIRDWCPSASLSIMILHAWCSFCLAGARGRCSHSGFWIAASFIFGFESCDKIPFHHKDTNFKCHGMHMLFFPTKECCQSLALIMSRASSLRLSPLSLLHPSSLITQARSCILHSI